MSDSKYLKVIYIYILAVANCLLLLIHCGRQYFPDTCSYLIAWDNLGNGQIDKWRTPIYPIFLGLLKTIFGQDRFPIYAVILQFLFFLVSIYFFNKLANNILRSKIISYWLTAFYALYPCIPTWNCFLITEPLAIYGIVFLLYSTVRTINTNSHIHIFLTSFWLLFLVFLRPALIYLLPVYFFVWLITYLVNKKYAKFALMNLVSIMAVGLSLLVYSYCYKINYGMITPSGIGVLNNYYIARLDGCIDPVKTNNLKLKAFVENSILIHGKSYSNGSSYDLYHEAEMAIDTYGLKDVSHLVASSYVNNKIKYTKRICLQIYRAATDKLFDSLLPKFRTIIDVIGIRINVVYLLLMLYTLLWILQIKKEKRFPFFSSILYLSGTLTANRVPSPSTLFTLISPLCILMTVCVMARPRAVPPSSRLWDLSAR